MKAIAIGADISINDVSTSKSLVKNVENDLYRLKDIGAKHASVTNVTGDDLVVGAFVEDKLVERVNQEIISILEDSAENTGDLEGISKDPGDAGEGVSYAEANIDQDKYPDALILAFDTYAGESFVGNVANSSLSAAIGMDGVTDTSKMIDDSIKKIPGVGYVSNETDDPVIIATVEDVESVGIIGSAMIGAALGNKNVYLVERGTPANVIPGSVIFSATAFMNGNVIDLAVPFQQRTRILKQ